MASVLVLQGCMSAPAVSWEFGPVDVASMQVYLYQAGDEEAALYQTSSRSEIAEVWDYLVGREGSSGEPSGDSVAMEGYRFELRDGSVHEATHAYGSPKANWIHTEEDGWRDVTVGGTIVGGDGLVQLDGDLPTVPVEEAPAIS